MSGQEGQVSDGFRPPVGINLDSEIRRLDLTTADVAQRLRVHERQVSRWRNSETTPSWSFVVQLARVFGRTPGWFYLDHSDEPDLLPAA